MARAFFHSFVSDQRRLVFSRFSIIFLLALLPLMDIHGQTLFSENMGTPSGTTTIAANTFQNSGTLTYGDGGQTNPGDVRNNTVSSGYTGASGGGNVWLTTTSGAYGFSIESINASAHTALTLQFGYYKNSSTAHATFSVDYWNGTSWVTVANTAATLFNEAASASIGWYLSKSLSLPAGAQISGLKIRFVKSSGTNGIRLDDVKLTGTSTTPCSGTPVPGNTVAATNPVVGGSTTALSMSGSFTGSGITYQWEQSADGVTGWTNVSGAGTSATYTASPTARTWYRCTVTCSGSSASSTPVEVTLTYCAPTYSSGPGTGDGIVNVTLGTLSNNSGNSTTPYYTFFNSVTIPTITQSASASVSVTYGSDATQFGAVWIDFNANGVFEASEGLVSTNAGANGTSVFNFTVPAGAAVGQTRMRVRGGNDAVLTTAQACGSSSSIYGESEDYIVNIVASSLTPSLAITGTTAHGSVCPGVAASSQTYTITNTGTASAAGLTVVSSDPQFVVSGLSATTVAGSGGTVTYVVTFTPSSAGAKTATITVASTTSGSNSPTSNLTGTGTATITPVAVTSAATAIGVSGATLGATSGTTFGACPTTTGKGFVISQTSTNSNPTVGGSGVTNETVTPLGTTGTAYTKAVSSLLPGTQYSFTAYVFDGTTYTYGTVLTFTTATPPSNDLCGSATALPPNAAAIPGTLVNSSSSAPFSDYKDVWYQFTPDCIGKYTITVGGFTGDVDVQLLNSCATTTILSSATTTANPEILTTSTLSASTTYYVRVRAFNAAAESSAFTIALSNQVAVVTQPSNASVTSGATANFASSLPANATGYQWQENTGSGWVNVSAGTGGTTNSYTTAATTMAMNGYQYRVIISNGTCSSVTSNAATLTVNACVPSTSNTSDYISNFTTTGGTTNIVHASSAMSTGGYGDFYGTYTVTQEVGAAISFSETYVGGNHGFNIWVDWNNDGTYATSERVYASGGTNSSGFSGSFTIPGGTSVGDYRMRIRAHFNVSDPASCSSINYGEAKDYKLTVVAACVTPATPTAPTSNSPQCLPAGVTLSKVGSAPSGETWYWQTSATGTAVAAVNSAATYSVTTPGTTTIYLRSRNNTTLCWSVASSVSVTVNAVTAITTQPASQSVYTGATATFSVVSSGGGLTYQWQVNTGSGWNNVTGADGTGGTTASFTTVSATLGMSGYLYRVIITGICGNETSNGSATLTVSPAPACTPIWEDNFDYGCTDNAHLPNLTSNWVRISGSANDFKYSSGGGLHYTGYASSGVGGAAEFKVSGDDLKRDFSATSLSSGSVYVSFLLNMASTTSTTDDYFLALLDASNAYQGRIYVQKSGTQYRLGVSKQSSSTADNQTGLLNFGTTYLVVVKYEMQNLAGNTDPFQMWVMSSGVPVSEAAAGTPISATASGTDAANLKSFALRQTNKAIGFIDGIRVATTWADAVCGGIAVAPALGTYTWTGDGNSTSWDNACNWSPRGIPGATDNVIINTSPTWKLNIIDSRTIKDFTLNGTGHFNMSSAGTLTINGNVTYGGTATATLNCASTVYITSTSSQPIPPLNYGNLEALGGDRVFPNGGTIGICSGFNVNPNIHSYTVTGSTVEYFSSGSGWVMIPFTYNNLKFTGTGDFSLGYSASNANKTYNVQGDFTQTAGIVYLGENSSATATINIDGNMTISGGTFNMNYTSGGTGIINLKGNLTVNGGTLTSTQTTNANLKFIGTSQQDVSIAGINNIYNVEINKTGGYVNLLTNFQSKRILTMTSGNMQTNANIFELGESITNKGTLTYTSGYIAGKMRRWFNGTNAADNATSLFPLGHGSTLKNRFVRVNYTTAPTGTAGYLTAQFVASPMGMAGLTILSAQSGGFGSDVTTTEDEGYWQIDNESGKLTNGAYTIACTGEGLSTATITNYTGVTLLKRVGGGNWTCPGTHIATTGSNAMPTVSRSGVTGWSNFGFGGNSANPLPVELISFTARCEKGSIVASWSTASEKNSDYFILQSSESMENWNEVSVVPAAGNTSVQQNYSATDFSSSRRFSYYRLVQVDYNGNKKLYGPVSVNCSREESEFLKVYPNPSTGDFTVAWKKENLSGTVKITLATSAGALIHEKTVEVSSGEQMVPFSEQLEAGVYYITLKGENGTETLKLVVKK